MGHDPISTQSVARGVAYTDPIVLRETTVSRLVFLPTLLDREDPLRGCFVYQRKSRLGQWQDVRGLSLGHLKSGEGYVLELKSAEVSRLVQGLLERRELYEQHGVEYGTHQYVSKDNLPQIVRGIVDFPESELADVLQQLDEEDVLNFGRKVDLSKLDSVLAEWRANRDNPDEDFWQDLLSRHAWVFSQVTGSPVVVVQEKAYVGGKSIENRGGGQVDYLCRNELTSNVSLIEIKTPLTKVCGAPYRTSGAFSLSNDITGGIVQVLGYKQTFEEEFRTLLGKLPETLTVYNPRCYLIAGRVDALSREELRTFELFRNAQAGVEILTFDEVERRLQGIRAALSSE